MTETAIQGVVLKPLVTHTDTRGFFREILRGTDDLFTTPFGQLSHSLMFPGVAKAWHLHRIQTDYWYILSGVLRVGLCDLRPESPTHRRVMDFLMGDWHAPALLKIPPGVAHGSKALHGPASIVYVTSHVYNPEDELRLRHDDPSIGFDWASPPPIK